MQILDLLYVAVSHSIPGKHMIHRSVVKRGKSLKGVKCVRGASRFSKSRGK